MRKTFILLIVAIGLTAFFFLGGQLIRQFLTVEDFPAPDVTATLNLDRALDSQAVQRLKTMPEFGGFVEAVTGKIDADYARLESIPHFPKELARMIWEQAQTVSGKENPGSKVAFGVIFERLIAVQMNVWAVPVRGKPNTAPKTEGTLTVVLRSNPSEIESFLKYIDKDHYSIIRKKGDFAIYRFETNIGTRFAGYAPLYQRAEYAVVVSEKLERIERQLNLVRTQRFAEELFGEQAPLFRFALNPSFFEKTKNNVLVQVKKTSQGNVLLKSLVGTLEKLERFEAIVGDQTGTTTGTTVGTIRLTIRSEDDAKKIAADFSKIPAISTVVLKSPEMAPKNIDPRLLKLAPVFAKISVSSQEEQNMVILSYGCGSEFFEYLGATFGETAEKAE